jgi:NAD(P)-dependent dehydrogenase (short-subunit alcohol dehydrogenase family)
VTGAGSGQGREIARRFAEEGAQVIATDVIGAAAEETANEIEGALALELDVTSQTSIDAALSGINNELGGFDTLINNAGVTITGRIVDLSESEWDRQLDTNLKSIYLMSKAAWPVLESRGGGCIVNTASIYGIWAAENDAAYCTSKAAVIMLTKCMALDGARQGIRVNCLCPGYIDTPMLDGFFAAQDDPEGMRAAAIRTQPLGRLGTSTDIAGGMVYLASDDAEWVTGTSLVIDGGVISGIWNG